jgi:hypothetical protein
MNIKNFGSKAAGLGVGIGCVGFFLAQTTPVGARETLSGQCGVDLNSTGISIAADGNLTISIVPNGQRRAARFRFFGTDSGSNYAWTHYQFRYGVSATNFGPQSNEVVRFGAQRNSPGDPYWSQYNSPDNHNSNLADGDLLSYQEMGTYLSPGGNTEIWTNAIFDVPNVVDPSCWTNAIATK